MCCSTPLCNSVELVLLGPQEQVHADLLPGDLQYCSSQDYCFSAELLQLSPSLARIQLTGALGDQTSSATEGVVSEGVFATPQLLRMVKRPQKHPCTRVFLVKCDVVTMQHAS